MNIHHLQRITWIAGILLSISTYLLAQDVIKMGQGGKIVSDATGAIREFDDPKSGIQQDQLKLNTWITKALSIIERLDKELRISSPRTANAYIEALRKRIDQPITPIPPTRVPTPSTTPPTIITNLNKKLSNQDFALPTPDDIKKLKNIIQSNPKDALDLSFSSLSFNVSI